MLNIDFTLFEAINGMNLPKWLDFILVYMRNSYVWGPLYVFIVSFALFNFKKKAMWFLLFSIMTVTTSDTVSSKIIKPNVERLRPCRTDYPLEVIARVKCGSGYSFTSSHATNHFALACFWVMAASVTPLRKKSWWLLLWAALIAFCQVYVGVHFPSDVIAGSINGIVIGCVFGYLYNRFYGLGDSLGSV